MANLAKRARAKRSTQLLENASPLSSDGSKKISDEELEKLQELNRELVSNLNTVAVTSLEKMRIEEELFDLREENQKIKVSMEEYLKYLGDKYSMINVDLATGQFKTKEDVEDDKEVEDVKQLSTDSIVTNP